MECSVPLHFPRGTLEHLQLCCSPWAGGCKVAGSWIRSPSSCPGVPVSTAGGGRATLVGTVWQPQEPLINEIPADISAMFFWLAYTGGRINQQPARFPSAQ